MSEELIAIGSDALTARINPLGAELWSLIDERGREYMTDADPAFWTGHAPLLFPIVGALKDGRYRLDGADYALPKHGFARHSRFEVREAASDRAVFRLGDSEQTREAYPFAFTLDMAFSVEGLTLRMAATISNPGERTLPFSFGYHPAFAWPLPGGVAKADHQIAFEQEEPGPVRRIDPQSGLILPDPLPTPVRGRELALDASLFAADALIWDRLASRSLRYGAPSGTTLEIAFPDTPMLGIWQKPGANYLCIEPWQGIADLAGYAGEFPGKPGIVILPPGETRSFRMDVSVLPR